MAQVKGPHLPTHDYVRNMNMSLEKRHSSSGGREVGFSLKEEKKAPTEFILSVWKTDLASLKYNTTPASLDSLRWHQVSLLNLHIELYSRKGNLGCSWGTDHGLVQGGPASVLFLVSLHQLQLLFRLQDSFLLYDRIIGIHLLN